MTPTEFTALASVWPTYRALAEDLGVDRSTIGHWRAGRRTIPEPAARLMRILNDHRCYQWINGQHAQPEVAELISRMTTPR